MATARVVIVDDEPSLIKFVSQNLRARGYDVTDAPNGLEGVDLVNLTKPFGIGELMARVRAVMRRVSQAQTRSGRQEAVSSGDLNVEFEHRRVTVKGEPVKLTPTEFSLLEQLVTRPDTVVTHRELLSSVWGAEYRDEAEYLRVYIGRLRRKLEDDPANPKYLLTEPGVGYRFMPEP